MTDSPLCSCGDFLADHQGSKGWCSYCSCRLFEPIAPPPSPPPDPVETCRHCHGVGRVAGLECARCSSTGRVPRSVQCVCRGCLL